MKYRTISRWVFILVTIGLVAFAGRLIHLRIKARAAQVAGPIPYTVTLRETVHNQGQATPGPETTWAIRPDGSRVVRIVGKSSQRILNFASGVEVTINDTNNTKSTIWRKDLSSPEWQRDPNSKCINSLAGKPVTTVPETLIGEETLAGYRTAKILRGGVTEWFALDYGCALVKDTWNFATGEVSEKSLVALLPGEPNAELFEIPAGAREVPPSERMLGPKKECPGCDASARKVFRRLDEEYQRLAVKP